MKNLFRSKKLVFLDIDGVFNSLRKIDNAIIVKHDWGNWQVSKENADFLIWLSENARCIWISTWGEESNQLNKFLGIKKFKAIYKGNKLNDIYAYAKQQDYLIIDDELSGKNIITPNSNTGLTKEDRQRIRNILIE